LFNFKKESNNLYYLFCSDRFDWTEDLEMEGLAAQRFSLLPMTTFGNATTALTPCYNSDHLAAGIHNSTGCKGSSLPVFVSLPHFQGSVANWLKCRPYY
jgi:hypothetical protein